MTLFDRIQTPIRGVYEMLVRRGVTVSPKPFAIGVRVELPQEQIDRAQYGRFAGNPLLGAASFRVTRRAESGAHTETVAGA